MSRHPESNMDEDLRDTAGSPQFDTFLSDLYDLETEVAELNAISEDAIKFAETLDDDKQPEELSSFDTTMESFQKDLRWGVAVKALVSEKMKNIAKFREDITGGLQASYVPKADYEALKKERDALTQTTNELRTQLQAAIEDDRGTSAREKVLEENVKGLQETIAGLHVRLKDAQDSALAEALEKFRRFLETENGTASKGQESSLLTPVLSPKSTQQGPDRSPLATLSSSTPAPEMSTDKSGQRDTAQNHMLGNGRRDSAVTLITDTLTSQKSSATQPLEDLQTTQSTMTPIQPLLTQSVHANVQPPLPSPHVTDQLVQHLTQGRPTADILKSPNPADYTIKSSLRADASREEIIEEIQFVGALLESLNEGDVDAPAYMIKFTAELEDLRQRLEVMDLTTAADLTMPDDTGYSLDRELLGVDTSRATQGFSKEVNGMMDRRIQYEDLASSLDTSGTPSNNQSLSFHERRKERRHSTTRIRSLQSQGAAEEQDMAAVSLNEFSRLENATRDTSQPPTDRSSSIEVIADQACSPSNSFGRIVSGQSLANMKVEPNELNRGYEYGYGYGEDDTYIPRRSRDDAQGQAKRRQTQPPSSLLDFDAGAALRRRQRRKDRRGQGNNSRRTARSTTPEH